MGYNKEDYVRVREEYSNKYIRAREAADKKRHEIHAIIPQVFEIDRILSGTGMDIMRVIASGAKNRDAQVDELQTRNNRLLEERGKLLVAAGYPADYTDVHYDCAECGDTGFLKDSSMCDCMRRALVREGYKSSGLGALIGKQTFDNFELRYYSEDVRVRTGMSVEMLKSFADGFSKDTYKNFIMTGPAGLGKTHLSTAVAQKVIDKGFDVLYISAVGMMNDFELKRFGNGMGQSRANEVTRYYDADLLIIDDLGTEVVNKFTQSYFYEIINTRMNMRKSTIINTNLKMSDIRDTYSERISSRILGEYQPLSFTGIDIRRQKQR